MFGYTQRPPMEGSLETGRRRRSLWMSELFSLSPKLSPFLLQRKLISSVLVVWSLLDLMITICTICWTWWSGNLITMTVWYSTHITADLVPICWFKSHCTSCYLGIRGHHIWYKLLNPNQEAAFHHFSSWRREELCGSPPPPAWPLKWSNVAKVPLWRLWVSYYSVWHR